MTKPSWSGLGFPTSFKVISSRRRRRFILGMRNLHTKGSDGGMWPKTRVSLTEFWGFDLGLIIFVLLPIQASWGINERVGTHVVDRPKGPEPERAGGTPCRSTGPRSR